MDRELIAHLGERFGQFDEQFAHVRDEAAEQFIPPRDELAHQFEPLKGALHEERILIEDMRREIRLVGERVRGINEKLDSFRRSFEEKSEEMLSILRQLQQPCSVLDDRVALRRPPLH